MKRAWGVRWISTLVLAVLLLTACGQSGEAKWQEQYDLGVRYLSEGNYEEAIIAFTAAIEIDPKRPEAYTGRGDAYALSGDTAENLAAALADYEAALALDETMADAWLGLADVYIRQGDMERAKAALEEGYASTGSGELKEELDRQTLAEYPRTERRDFTVGGYAISEYDEYGNLVLEETYSADETLSERHAMEYDERGWMTAEHWEYTRSDGIRETHSKYYNENRQLIREQDESYNDQGGFAQNPHTTSTTRTYQYDGADVQIEIFMTQNDGASTARGIFTFSMQSPDHYIEARSSGFSFITGEVFHPSVTEYRLEETVNDVGRTVPEPVRVAVYDLDENGNITNSVTY